MGLNILAGFLFVIAMAAGVWGWWIDNGSSFRLGEKKKMEQCDKVKNE